MELRTTREMRRNEQLTKALNKKTAGEAVPAQAQTAQRQPKDKFTLSREALAFLEQQNRLTQELEERRARQQSRIQDSLSAMETKEKELDLMSKALKVLEKCQKIAASIMKGNRVPPEDLEYLRNNDPDGYKLALAMRRENPDPEDEESVLDDEDRNGSIERTEGGGESPSVESTAPSDGGGDAAPTTE